VVIIEYVFLTFSRKLTSFVAIKINLSWLKQPTSQTNKIFAYSNNIYNARIQLSCELFTQKNAKHSFNVPKHRRRNQFGNGYSSFIRTAKAVKVNHKKYEGIYTFGLLFQPHG